MHKIKHKHRQHKYKTQETHGWLYKLKKTMGRNEFLYRF